jgi:hypothetical protein
MNEITTTNGTPVTMTSLELVDFINSQRKEGEAELRHDNFMAKVPTVLGDGVSLKFRTPHVNLQNGQTYQIYRFPKREALLMAMSYGNDMMVKVFDQMTESQVQTQTQTQPQTLQQQFIDQFEFKVRCGMPRSQAAYTTNDEFLASTGVNLLEKYGIVPQDDPVPTALQVVDNQWFTPTQLGRQIGVSGHLFNLALEHHGFQVKRGRRYVPTQKAAGLYVQLDDRNGQARPLVNAISW